MDYNNERNKQKKFIFSKFTKENNERYNIILSTDIKGYLNIRKYYDFNLMVCFRVGDSSFVNKIKLNNYDIICTINYNFEISKFYLALYSINGILLDKSEEQPIKDSYILKNGKIIFNNLEKKNLYIFGLNKKKDINNDKGYIIEDNILVELGFADNKSKNNIIEDNNMFNNFIIAENNIYILFKNGKIFKGSYNKLDLFSYGVNIFE